MSLLLLQAITFGWTMVADTFFEYVDLIVSCCDAVASIFVQNDFQCNLLSTVEFNEAKTCIKLNDFSNSQVLHRIHFHPQAFAWLRPIKMRYIFRMIPLSFLKLKL